MTLPGPVPDIRSAPRAGIGAFGWPSIGQKLDERGGFGPGFDFLRLFLAVAVLVYHTPLIVTGTPRAFDTHGWLLSFSIVPMFFALSGFLVAASAERLPLRHFMLNRAIRILPGLAVETWLSALILGLLFTTLPIGDYFTDGDFYEYFLAIVGWIQFDLPGVFQSNPLPGIVNGSLWTVPQELAVYALLALLVATGLFKKPLLPVALAVAMLILDGLLQSSEATSGNRTGNLYHGTRLIGSFFFGCAIYKYRHRIPAHPALAGLILVALVLVSWLGSPEWRRLVLPRELSVPVTAYLAVLLGLFEMPRIPFFWRGDYSYGIYLYAFPVQQSIMQLLPNLQSTVLHCLLSLAVTTAFAAFSWHAIEKPLLRYRGRFALARGRVDPASRLAVP